MASGIRLAYSLGFTKLNRRGGISPDYEAAFVYFWREYAPDNEEPTEQFKPIPGRNFRSDFAFPAYRLLIEIDGGQWSIRGGRHNRDSDREKLNLCAIEGYRVMRYSGDMLMKDPKTCILQVVAALKTSTLGN